MKYRVTFSENLFDEDHTIYAYGDASDLAMLNSAVQSKFYVSSVAFFNDEVKQEAKKDEKSDIPF